MTNLAPYPDDEADFGQDENLFLLPLPDLEKLPTARGKRRGPFLAGIADVAGLVLHW